jgi:SAM-dependent methyltransferase
LTLLDGSSYTQGAAVEFPILSFRLTNRILLVPSNCPSFACPVHKTELDGELFCISCLKSYPSANGIPVLINEENSVFRASDYLRKETAYAGTSSYTGHLDTRSGFRQLYRRAISHLTDARMPIREFDAHAAIDYVLDKLPQAKILVIGAGDTTYRGNVTYTDVAFGRNVSCIADAHDLPFMSESFDACFACAVLEHVVDPYRCVSEIARVLRPGGYVMAATPFMFPVHMREHDFTRFTYLGHRRLFRYFDDLYSGMYGGPGVSVSAVLRYAIFSLSDRPVVKKWLRLIGVVSAFPFRWLDYLTCANLSAYDSAAGFYFFGSLRAEPIADRDLLKLYRGG